MATDIFKTYKYYPKYISTFILSEYVEKNAIKKEDGIHNFEIDDLVFEFDILDKQITECLILKNNQFYDYFCRKYIKEPKLKPDEIV